MPKEISLRLCLLNSIVEKPREEFQDQLLVREPKSNCAPHQGRSEDKQDFVTAAAAMRRESEELW
jgi:transposase